MDCTKYLAYMSNYFQRVNPTILNAVNKGATSKEVFKKIAFETMENKVPTELQEEVFDQLCNELWNYDFLKEYIYDREDISDIACHSWDNVWLMSRGKWSQCPMSFRDADHYNAFFNHVCKMNDMVVSHRNATANCTDIDTCPKYRLRLNFSHKSINTDDNNVFSIRKISKTKKTLEFLTRPEEGMLTPEMIPIIKNHLKEATGILIVGMGGSGKTTFLNALFEELPLDWKYLVVQENEELFSYTHKNSDFLRTVQAVNAYDVSHDLKEIARNALLMSVRCYIIGETKGEEALYLLNTTNTGAVGITTAHSDSSEHGLEQLARYIKYASDYSFDQCMDMLTIMNKVFFMKDYRLKEISTIRGYDFTKHKLILDTEYYN